MPIFVADYPIIDFIVLSVEAKSVEDVRGGTKGMSRGFGDFAETGGGGFERALPLRSFGYFPRPLLGAFDIGT